MNKENVVNGCILVFFVLLPLGFISSPLWYERVYPIPEKSELIERKVDGPLEFKLVSSGNSIGRMIFADGTSISFGWHDLERCRLALESLNRKVILLAPEDSKSDWKVWEIRELYEDRPPAYAFSYEEVRHLESRQPWMYFWVGWIFAAFLAGMVVFERHYQRKHRALVERTLGKGE